MSTPKPQVSIGMAVYNGEKYLEQAINSILAQTFTDFELIISDNASSDRTPEICKRFAAQDNRIRYQRNPTNIGGANNENSTFRLSRGEYFRWAAYDDICAPELLEKCVQVLDSDPSVILCYTGIYEIDEFGNPIKTTFIHRGKSIRPHERFRDVAAREHHCEESYGLMRSEIVRRTRLQLNYTDSDRVFLTELSLYGRFHEIPEPLFYKRYHPKNEYLDWRTRMAWFDPSYEGRIVFPNWIQFLDFIVTIQRVPLPVLEKIRCYLHLFGPWLFKNGKKLIKDVIVAATMLAHSRQWRKQRYTNTSNWS
jgi:glycosyltransferase involved in cell wall biosynthesis